MPAKCKRWLEGTGRKPDDMTDCPTESNLTDDSDGDDDENWDAEHPIIEDEINEARELSKLAAARTMQELKDNQHKNTRSTTNPVANQLANVNYDGSRQDEILSALIARDVSRP